MKMEKMKSSLKVPQVSSQLLSAATPFFSLHLCLVLLGMLLPTKLRVTASISTFTVS